MLCLLRLLVQETSAIFLPGAVDPATLAVGESQSMFLLSLNQCLPDIEGSRTDDVQAWLDSWRYKKLVSLRHPLRIANSLQKL